MSVHESTGLDQSRRLIISGAQRLQLQGAQQLVLWDDEPDRLGSGRFDPVMVGTPVASRVPFVVQDGWQLQVLMQLKLFGAIRATVQGTGQIIIDDYGPRTRIVLSGTSK